MMHIQDVKIGFTIKEIVHLVMLLPSHQHSQIEFVKRMKFNSFLHKISYLVKVEITWDAKEDI